MILFELFLSFLQVGLFSVGGGYASIPIIESQAVNVRGWLNASEFADLVTIAEMTPGPIAVNAATFVGIRVAGIPGALVATLGCILPSLVILTVLWFLYKKYRKLDLFRGILSSLRPVIVALIAATALSMILRVIFPDGSMSFTSLDYAGVLLFSAALFVMKKFRFSPVPVMFACGFLYLAWGLIAGKGF